MNHTPASLLDRLRKPNESSAWERFVELYSPLLFAWAKRLGLQASDAADLVQDVFLLLLRKLPEFEYDATRSFHAWLKTVFVNQYRLRLRNRVPVPIDGAADGIAVEAAGPFDDPEYRHYLIKKAFALVAREFTPMQQSAFQEYVLRERPPEDVARELGIRPGTIYGIKSKILSRLRQELRGMLN